MRLVRLFLVLLFARASAQAAALDAIASADRLERSLLVAAVLERNPSIEAARQAWRAAAEVPARASALDDPMVSYAIAPLSVGSAAVDFGQELEVAQPLPYPGKRRLRGGVAAAEAEALLADLGELRSELARRASILHADYVLVHEALRINAEHVELLESLLRVATDRYVAGLASQQDPLQAESELAHLLHDEVVLRSERAVLATRINTLLRRPPDAALPPPEVSSPDIEASGEAGLHLDADLADSPGHEDEALASRPELRAREASTRARQAELELARLSRRPDFAVISSYSSMWSDGEHRFMAGGSVTLPIRRSRVRAEVAEAEARLARALSERAAMEDQVRGEVHESAERLRESHQVLDLYASRLLPVARDLVEAALAGFRAGKNDFLALIEAERNLRRVELDRERALAYLARNRVELERALGRGGEPADAASANETTSERSEPSGEEP